MNWPIEIRALNCEAGETARRRTAGELMRAALEYAENDAFEGYGAVYDRLMAAAVAYTRAIDLYQAGTHWAFREDGIEFNEG